MKYLIISAFFLFAIKSFSQTPMTLEECENQFLKSNLYLLSNHYNVDIAQAQTIQAKIWDHPNFGFEMNAWAPNEENQFFNAGKDGEKVAYIQQLIHIGGQRRNQVDLSKSNEKLAELNFTILMRDLKFQLRNYFFGIYYDSKTISQIDKQLANLKTLIDAYTEEEKKGNVSLKDLVRLQNLYVTLKNDRTDLMTDMIENKKNLDLIINAAKDQNYAPSPTGAELEIYKKPITNNTDDLQKTALENRPDLEKAKKIIETNNLYLKLQKSLSVPDLTLGAAYDQRGGAFTNQTNLTVGIPLPLWNKNKGNIKMAQTMIEQATAEKNIKDSEILFEVKSAFSKYLENKSNFDMISGTIPSNLEKVFNGVYENFLKRNISMLEFTDFLESYNQNVISFNKINKSYINACEEMNYVTASKLF